MADERQRVDWAGLATRAMDTAIVVIGNRVQGIRTPVGSAVSIGKSGFSLSSNILPYLLIGTAIVGAAFVFKGR